MRDAEHAENKREQRDSLKSLRALFTLTSLCVLKLDVLGNVKHLAEGIVVGVNSRFKPR